MHKIAQQQVADASGASSVSRRWIHGSALFGICSVLLAWAFRSEIAAAVQVWTDSRTFGHAFFIFPITLFLFYRLRPKLATLRPEVAPWALVLIVGASLVWMVGKLANLMVVQQFAFVGLWQSLFLLVLGWQITRAAVFPLAYLYFAVPFGSSIIPALQTVTAQIVVHLLRYTGIPVFLEGYYIEIPTGSFLVAEACSGVRYLIVCIALGVLAANLFFRSWPRRMLFIGLSIIVPIVANGIRAYGIIILAHFGHYKLAFDVDHVVYGFVFLCMVTLSLLGLGALLRDGRDSPFSGGEAPVVADETSDAARTTAISRFGQPICAGIAMAFIASIQFWAVTAMAPPAQRTVTLRAPTANPPWVLGSGEAPNWSPEFRGMDARLQQSYRLGERRVQLEVAYYTYQREGAEALSDLNAIMGGRAETQVLSSGRSQLRLAGAILPINGLVVRHANRTFLVWYWYWIGGETTDSRLAGKLLELKTLVTGGQRAAAILAVSSEVVENTEGTAALLDAFLQGLKDGGTPFEIEPSPPSAVSGARAASLIGTGALAKP